MGALVALQPFECSSIDLNALVSGPVHVEAGDVVALEQDAAQAAMLSQSIIPMRRVGGTSRADAR